MEEERQSNRMSKLSPNPVAIPYLEDFLTYFDKRVRNFVEITVDQTGSTTDAIYAVQLLIN